MSDIESSSDATTSTASGSSSSSVQPDLEHERNDLHQLDLDFDIGTSDDEIDQLVREALFEFEEL